MGGTNKRRAHDGKEPLYEYAARGIEEHTGGDLRAYKCRFCPFWHVGHLNRYKRRRAAQI